MERITTECPYCGNNNGKTVTVEINGGNALVKCETPPMACHKDYVINYAFTYKVTSRMIAD